MTQEVVGTVPELTLGWRLRMAIESDCSVNEMADYLGVDRATVSRWCHDKSPVARGHLVAIAVKTGVPLAWIETGVLPDPDGGGENDETRNILLGRQRLYQLSYVRDAALADGGDNLVTLSPCA